MRSQIWIWCQRYWPFGTATRGFQAFALFRQTAAIIVSIILAKSRLATADIGEFETWLFLGLIITLVCLNGSLQMMAQEFRNGTLARRDHRIFNVYLLNIGTVLVASSLIYMFAHLFSWRGVSDLRFLSLVLVYLFLHLTSAIMPYIFLVRDQAYLFLPYCLFYLVGYVLAVCLPLTFGFGLYGVLWSLLAFATIEHLLVLYAVFEAAVLRINLRFLTSFFRQSIPLSVYAGIGIFAQVFDAWLVQYVYEDFSVFAQFRFGARELPGSLALAGAFTAAMLLFLKGGSEGLQRIKVGSQRLMHAFFPITLVLMWISPWLFGWVYNDDFLASAWVFNTYLLLMISRWIFPHVILISRGDSNFLVAVSMAELCLNVMLSTILVSYLGLVGIAIATAIAFAFEKLVLIVYVRRKYQIKLSAYAPIKTWTIYSSLVVLSYLVVWLFWR